VGVRALRRRPWGAPAHFLHSFKNNNQKLSRNLDQSMLKNACFLEKIVKNRLCVGGSAPEPPLPPDPRIVILAYYYNFVKFIFSTKCSLLSLSKEQFLQLFFTSNSIVFVDRGRKNIFCPRAQDTLATPLSLIYCERTLITLISSKSSINS